MGVPIPLPLRRMKGTDLWHASIELPRGARIQYRILVRRGDQRGEHERPAQSARRVATPSGRSRCSKPTATRARTGRIPIPRRCPGELVDLRIASKALRREAHVTVYVPARMRRDRRMPLLVVHDGGDFLNHSSMGTVLDNLMHRRLIADCLVVFTHPGDRLREYAASLAHSRFLTSELVPQLEGTFQLRGAPSGRVLMGASFGGVASLAAAVRAPGFYGGLLLESPSLRFTGEPGAHSYGSRVRAGGAVRQQGARATHRSSGSASS